MERENLIAKQVIDLCFDIHKLYGPGLFESVYERILVYELKKMGFEVSNQVPISLNHEELYIPHAFVADLIVEGCLLVELKSVNELPKLFYKQVITYLKLTDLSLGLLVNFNVNLMKDGIHRMINK